MAADVRHDVADLFRRGIQAWHEGAFDRAAEENWHPDIVLYDPPELPDAGVHRGREAALGRFAQYTEPLGRFRLHLEDVIDGQEAVFVAATFSGVSPGAGVPVDQRIFYVLRLEADQIIEMRVFLLRDAALQAAGIIEQG
jgi:ketosteroid isomerase-like protein